MPIITPVQELAMLHDPLLEIVCEYAWPTVTAGRLVVVIVQGGARPTASIAPNDGGVLRGLPYRSYAGAPVALPAFTAGEDAWRWKSLSLIDVGNIEFGYETNCGFA
jgi:hypothetical protein